MKNHKWMTYVSLLVLLVQSVLSPVAVLAETLSSTEKETALENVSLSLVDNAGTEVKEIEKDQEYRLKIQGKMNGNNLRLTLSEPFNVSNQEIVVSNSKGELIGQAQAAKQQITLNVENIEDFVDDIVFEVPVKYQPLEEKQQEVLTLHGVETRLPLNVKLQSQNNTAKEEANKEDDVSDSDDDAAPEAEEKETEEDLPEWVEILTDEMLEISEVDLTYEEPTSLSSNFMFSFNWKIKEKYKGKIKNGTKYEFDLPNEFVINPDTTAEGNLGDLGRYQVVGKKVVFTFNDSVENLENIEGDFKLSLKIDREVITTNDEIVIKNPFSDTEIGKITIESELPKGIEKEGTFDQNTNPTQINWEIIVNKRHDMLDGLVIEEHIAKDQEIDWDSLEIVEQKYDLDGNLLENGIVVSKEDYDIENNQIIFKNSSKKAYKIKFVAKIKENADYEKNGTHTFKNNVIQKSKNSEPLSKDAQVKATFEKRLTKNLLTHDKVEQTIKWEIDFNKGKNKLPSDKAYIKDSLSSKSGKAIYNEESFEVKDVETEEILEKGTDYELEFEKSEGQEAFELKFKESPFERYVKITYTTKYEEGYIVDKEDKVSNKAETDNGSGEGEVVNNQQNIVKTEMGVDYENKHLKWQITINKQKLRMSDVEINDKFGTSGMLLLNDTLVIKDVKGNELPNTEYTITKSDSTGFKIEFKQEVSEELIINFSTSFERTEEKVKIFKNKSSITWTTNGKKYTSESGAEQKLNNEFQHNGKKIGKYDAEAKRIDWEIWLNYNNEDIPTLTVSDTIEGNQKLIEDSKELYQGKINGQELITDGEAIQDYTFKYDEESKTFTLEKDLKDQTNKRYVFKYSTSLKDEVVKEEYKNRATVKYGNDREDELTESVKPDNGGKFVYKKGERIEDGKEKLKWDITLNPSGSYIKDFKLVDRPSTNHMILEDTIRIKGLTKGVDYTQSLTTDFETGQQTLEIEFLIIIKKEYTLTYDTEVLLLGEGKNVFGNQIEVTGSNDKIKQVEKSKEIEVQHVTSGGSATGTNTDLKIIKEDNTNSQKPVNLKGIEFDLLNEKGRKIREITTDTQGEAVIKGIITGTYFLKEKNLPEGYLQSELTGDKGQKIVVRKNNENTIPTIKVYNTKNIFTLTKVDEKGNAIKSGETTFSLSKDGVDLREVKTDESGKLVLRGLEKGNYELVETTAPTGYIKNPTPIKFKVTGEETEEVLLGENGKWTNYQGSVFLQKEDIHGTPLEGAEFGLFDKKTGKIIDKVTSDSKGKVSFSGIAPGEYYIQETKAAPGYLLNDQKVRFTVTNTSEKKITPKDLGVVKNYRGSMTLTKTNEAKEKLAGATFIIERQLPQNKWEQIDEERTTNKEGVVTFSDLAPGVYRLVEVSAPTGYVKNTEPVEFEVKDGVAKDVVQYAKEMTNYQGSVQLIKEDDLGHGLANAEFTLFNENDEVVHENIVSNKQGIVSVKDLAPGNYYFKEVKAPEGYQLNTTPIEFTIAAEAKGKPDVLKVSESFINYQGKFTLEKKDEKGQALKGAEFVLYQKGKSTPYRKDLVTNQEGKIVLDNLPVGDYELKEVSAPTGYITNTEVIAFEITPEATEKQQIEDSFINYQGSAKLQKVNEASEGLAGAKFDVYLEDKVTPIATGLESDEDGNVIVRDLAPGKYYFKETQAPTGYQLNDTPIAFTIEKEAKGEPVVLEAGQLTNYQGKVVLTKINEAKDALANAIFSLYTEAGEEVAKDLTTDENGQLTVDHLAPGKYYFEETQAPTGYLLNQEKLAFEITAKSVEKEVVAVTFTNYQGSAKLQKVNQLGEALADAVFEVVDEAGTVVADGLVSNEQGEVVVTGLAPGVYHFKETQAPVGYKLNESLSAPFEIPNEATGILPTVEVGNFVNYQGHVTLTKIDDKKRTLEGAVFELFNAKFDEKAVVTGLRSNESGQIEVGNLPVGDYYLREVVAAPGHILNTEEIHFTISETGSEMEEKHLVFQNYLGAASLTKVNEANEGLIDAVFDVYSSETGLAVATGLESDEDGNVIVRDLAPGKYYFKETQAPTGYQLNDTPIAFTIEKEAKGEPVVLDAGQLTNYQGKVVLAKVNEANDALANAVFSLYTETGEEIAKDLTTDENGQLTVDHLAPGKYYFEETQTPTGYLLNQEKLAFEIKANSVEKEVVDVTFTNYQGSAKLQKTDEKGKGLANAKFNVYQEGEEKPVRENLESDAKGFVYVQDLAPGYYYFQETEAPAGHQLNDSKLVFKIAERTNGKPEEVTVNSLVNYQGKVILTKANAENNVLEGAVFSLYNQDGHIIDSELKTNPSGEITVDNLKPGHYYFQETQAAPGYVLNTEKVQFEISKHATEKILTEVSLINYQGSAKLQKVNEASEGLAGAKFDVYLEDKVTPIATGLESDEDGNVIVRDLAPGKYYFKEAQAPTGYQLNDTPIAFTIEKEAKGEPVVLDAGQLTNYQGKVVLTKVNEANDALANAVFSLYTEAGEEVAKDLTTDENGQLTVDHLAPGKYYFEETQAPTGYLLNQEKLAFEIKANSVEKEVVAVTFTNYQGSAKLQKVNQLGEALADAVFEVVDEAGTVVADNLVSNEQGEVVVTGLAPGIYHFKETKAPVGYKLNESLSAPFEIPNEATGILPTVEVGNFVNYQGHVTLTKIDDKKRTLEGAVFELFNAKFDEKAVVTGLRSNESGKIEVGNLPVGDYYLREVVAAPGHILNTEEIHFTISNTGSEMEEYQFNFYNYQGSAKLQKVNEAGEGLAGAKFDVYLEDKVTPIATGLESDEDGNVIVRDLAPGKYYFKETQAPTGYQLNDTPIAFTIEKEAKGEPVVLDAGQLTNYQGKVVLTKINEANDALANAIFSLYTEAGEEVAKDLTTDEVGQLTVDHLAPGKYYFEETQAPTGYLLNQEKLAFEITEKNAEKEVVEVTFTNYQGSALLVKRDGRTNQTLAKATFELRRADNTLVEGYEQVLTNEHGELLLDALAPGSYQLIETQAPTGYQLDKTPVTFTVQAAEKGQPKRIELEKINHRIPEVTKDKPNKPSFLPQTNEIQSSAWLIVGLGFMAVSGYGYYRRYNR